MSKLITQIQQSQKQYRIAAVKEKNNRAKIKATVLSTLLGEIETKQKNTGAGMSDEDVIALIKKFIKDINTSLAVAKNEDLLVELEALNVFLPRQMSQAELKSAVARITQAWKDCLKDEDFGKIMGILKNQYAGQYDGSEAAKVVKAMIKGN